MKACGLSAASLGLPGDERQRRTACQADAFRELADAARGADRPADLTAIVGTGGVADENGWRALKETIAVHGADAETYQATDLGDRYFVEVWGKGGRRAMTEWEKRLGTLERR